MTEEPREPRDPTDMSHPNYDPAEDPTHPFYEGNKMEGEQKPGPSSAGRPRSSRPITP